MIDGQYSSKEKIDTTLFDYMLFDYTAHNIFLSFFSPKISGVVLGN